MLKYLLWRLIGLFFVLLVVSFLTFLLARSVPGGPFDELNMPLSPAAKANIQRKYGLDQPFYVQWAKYVVAAVQGDFGYSYRFTSQKITTLFLNSWGPSLILGGLTLLWSIPAGIIAGVVAAVKRNTWVDSLVTLFAIVGSTIPNFALGVLLLLIFSSILGVLPNPANASGWQPARDPRILIIPVFVFGLLPFATLARYTRSNLLEVMSQDYIRTARAKGASANVVLFKHALRNSLVPVLTVAGPFIPMCLTGSAILERQFSIPGIGPFFIDSINTRDYPLVMASVLIIAVLWGITYLVTDLLYLVLDPRIRLTQK
jgi:ABC-type dipeptide/oligopeptide/nickel transport system permease component